MNPEDHQRLLFLQKLAKSELMLSEWEQRFVDSFMAAGRQSLWFTPGRCAVTDKLRMKFGNEPEIKMPFFSPSATAPRPEAAPGGCMFQRMDESRRPQPCNAPAVWQRANGFRYCEACAQSVMEYLRRQGKTMNLGRWKP